MGLLDILRPDMAAHRITDLDPLALRQQGVGGLLLDVDNTLTVWHGMDFTPELRQWLGRAKDAGLRLVILSNGHRPRLEIISRDLDLPALAMSGKPWPWAFRKGCRLLELPPKQVAMVGDQLFTDVLGANLSGLTSILTDWIDPHEMWGTSHIARPLERWVQRRWAKATRRKEK